MTISRRATENELTDIFGISLPYNIIPEHVCMYICMYNLFLLYIKFILFLKKFKKSIKSKYNYIVFSLPFLPSTSFHTPSPIALQIHDLILFNCYDYINIWMHKCINATCWVLHVYDFRPNHLASDNDLKSLSLGKTISSALSIPKLSVVLCLVLCELPLLC